MQGRMCVPLHVLVCVCVCFVAQHRALVLCQDNAASMNFQSTLAAESNECCATFG